MSTEHGANLFDISNSLHLDKSKIMDFSSNINPFGASKKAKQAVIDNINMVSIYPDPDYKKLKKSLSEYCGCNSQNILLGEGATELITSCIKMIAPKNTLLLSPAYSEYEKCLKKIGSHIEKFFYTKEKNFIINPSELIKKINESKPDLVIICNPNNPTGSAFTRKEIKEILDATDTFFMVDETYVEFCDYDTYSSTPLTDIHPNLFVIRGTSKFFSVPGIRLGYGITTSSHVFEGILNETNLWNINIFATLMGEIMFKDKEYIEMCRSNIKREFEYLQNELSSLPFLKVYNSNSNFMLCEILSPNLTARSLYDYLYPFGIIIRNATSFDGLETKFFRVCVLTPEANRLLIKKLKEISY
jgi:threonine-phosphate decarboxylase